MTSCEVTKLYFIVVLITSNLKPLGSVLNIQLKRTSFYEENSFHCYKIVLCNNLILLCCHVLAIFIFHKSFASGIFCSGVTKYVTVFFQFSVICHVTQDIANL